MKIDKAINDWTFDETIKTAESLMEVESNAFKCDVIRHLTDFAEKYREQLKEYQQLEEERRPVKLPCKVGDDVWFVPSHTNYKLNILNHHREENKIFHQKVVRITFSRNGWYLECDKDLEYATDHILIDKMYKETWFLTESEAEAKLKELRGEENATN